MKYILAVLLSTVVTCSTSFKEIKGNKKIVKQEIKAGTITEVSNSGICDVFVKQGNKQKIVIETDENILPYIKYKIEGQKISFYVKSDVSLKPTKCHIFLTLSDISAITNEGNGDLKVSNFKFKTPFEIYNAGNGDVVAKNLNGNKITIKNRGNGDVVVENITLSQVLKIDNAGNGDVEVKSFKGVDAIVSNAGNGDVELNDFAVKKLIKIDNEGNGDFIGKSVFCNKVKISNAGRGDAELSGEATYFDINNNSAGDVEVANFKADFVTVINEGAGNVEVFANKSLSMSNYGSGTIVFKKSAGLNSLKVQGPGEFRQVN